jgi:hypothetical protein
MRGGRDAALEFIEVNDVQAVARARVVGRARDRAAGRAKGEPPDASHAIDAHSHPRFSLA